MAIFEVVTNNKGVEIPTQNYRSCHGKPPHLRAYTTRSSRFIDLAAFCQNPECPLHQSGAFGYPEEFPDKWNKAVLSIGCSAEKWYVDE